MQTYPFELEYFVTDDGKVPFKEWFDSLRDIAARAKIRIRLDRARLGNLGDSRSVGGGVRIKGRLWPGLSYLFCARRQADHLIADGR